LDIQTKELKVDKAEDSEKMHGVLIRKLRSKVNEIVDWINAQTTPGVNLANVKEIEATTKSHIATEKLKTGDWELLDAKIVEIQHWMKEDTYRQQERHVHKSYELIYMIGRTKRTPTD